MIHIKVVNNAAVATVRELLTHGSVGVRAAFTFSDEWDGLTRVAVFEGSGTSKDILLGSSNECAIPFECLADYGGHLRIGVYGTDAETIVKPTVWVDAGRIEKGAAPSGLDPEEFTPTLAQQAIDAAEAVQTAAERGDFDGANAVIWYTSSAPTSRSALSGGYIATSALQGPSGAAVAAGQMIVSSNTGKAYWIAGPEDDGVVPLETYDIQITANS